MFATGGRSLWRGAVSLVKVVRGDLLRKFLGQLSQSRLTICNPVIGDHPVCGRRVVRRVLDSSPGEVG